MSQTTTVPRKKIECFSMTGYAQARAEQDGWAVRVSVKSVNHRFLDLKLRMPEGFDLYDLRLRQIVRERIHRGHVEVTVSVEPGKAAPVQVNRELVQSYLKAAEALRQETPGSNGHGRRRASAIARSDYRRYHRRTGVGRRTRENSGECWTPACAMRLQSWMICVARKDGTWSMSCASAWRASKLMWSKCAAWLPRCVRLLRGAWTIN